jgi:putative membrane protein
MRFNGAGSLFLAAVLLGFVNAFVRPVVVILTLPLTLVTLGLFIFVINGAMLLLVSRLMPSFQLEGMGTAIIGWLVVALTGWMANGFVDNRGRVSVWKVKH